MHRLSPLPSIVALFTLIAISSWPATAQKFHAAMSTNELMARADPVGLFDDRPDGCPPCFNCNLEDFVCHQFANCSAASGRCSCPPGFGGEDCATPTCGSLADKERAPRKGDTCQCDEGWSGINCNVCNTDDACSGLVTGGAEASPVCYKEGLVVKENFQQCGVTNKKILEMLKGKQPDVTFSCNAGRRKCNFQFWVDQHESFYCDLDTCKWKREVKADSNITSYHCETAQCKCVPGRMLCGETGSIDIGDFLGAIKGPADFTSTWKNGKESSTFSEEAMNGLISSVFGDPSISLSCNAGECMALTEVPGYERPIKKINTPLIAGVIAGCALFIVAVILLLWYLGRGNRRYASIHLSDDEEDESAKLLADHKPANLQFQNVSYLLNGRQILADVQGSVQPGELMAIMGASGAGKTTFLDILARKNKKGQVNGDFFINGEKILDSEFRSIIGFVDQEDTLLPTLTVHETIMDSAMLRLPKEMSLAAKRQKVDDVERQLGIHHIRHQIIGSEEGSGRGISGGEKRRVGIACELVTSPSILFLDEPTSGLDAFNAFNVIECLVNLVKNYNRTVIFTIHQPRSNIVALFDQLVLLARGRIVYSGPFSSCQSYFDSIGYSCPPGFNIADYLVDLTMHAGRTETPMDEEILASSNPDLRGTASRTSSAIAVKSINVSQNDSEDNPSVTESLLRPKNKRRASIKHQQERQLFTRKKTGTETASPRTSDGDSIPDSQISSQRQQWLRLSKQNGLPPPRTSDDGDSLLAPAAATGTDLDVLVSSYANSEVARTLSDDMSNSVRDAATANGGTFNGNGSIVPVAGKVKGYRKVGFVGQFIILSARTWKNLYRNPMLLLVHYAVAILLAVLVGFLFFSLTDDIKGFQNRLGLCFFLLALFGFSSLSGLTTFSTERLLFVKERSKGFYAPISYFTAKVLFDIIPLRLIPPMIMAAIIYPMTGLVPAWAEFWKFVLILVLFNLACAAICLCIGVLIKNGGLANLVGSLIMLFSLLLSGFLLNSETIPYFVHWLQLLSVFHYGFESLMVNEVRYLTLIDHKYGLDIEVPGATILSSFGFNVLNLWTDVRGLAIFAGVLIIAAYLFLHFLLVERR